MGTVRYLLLRVKEVGPTNKRYATAQSIHAIPGLNLLCFIINSWILNCLIHCSVVIILNIIDIKKYTAFRSLY